VCIGIEDGMSVRVPNAGDAPMSGKGSLGDLLVRVRVAPSKQFQRQGANLYHQARIPMHTALLGGKVRVPTLDGDVDVRVPSGTQPGEEMVLKGRGVSSVYGSSHGDLFVAFSVQLPRYDSGHPYQVADLNGYIDLCPDVSENYYKRMQMTLKAVQPLAQAPVLRTLRAQVRTSL
jgi:DnaJ-class molecular chaperone